MRTVQGKMRIAMVGLAALVVVGTLSSAQALFKYERGGFDNSIVDTAIAVNSENGEFSTLLAALQAAGLVKLLDLSPEVVGLDSIAMLSRYSIYPRVTLSGVFVTDADRTPSRILVEEGLFDIETDNGVIHVIDNVLLFPRAVD